jgi:phosphohistidine phosphatase
MIVAMLTLALLRHAKSSWDDHNLDDFDRPLNDRGRMAAPVMGQMLVSLKFTPQLILCSPSRRTRETLALVEPVFAKTPPVIDFEKRLYLAGASDILARLRLVPAPAATVLVIGHNPGLHALAAHLAITGDTGQLTQLQDKFPTAALAVFSFSFTTWADLTVQSGHLEAFITPKDRA